MTMKYFQLIKALFVFVLFSSFVFGQHEHEKETSWEVPELWDFHEVIYQLWHEAWPDKDVDMLKELLPELETGFAKVKAVELPGILRDKKPKWDELIKMMDKTLESYKDAIDKNDSESLLKAAEDVHATFEKFVRTIRPVLKEVDAFHQELYMLYHYYLPDYNIERIAEAAEKLKEKSAELDKAELPKRLTKKEKQFNHARSELSSSVTKLNDLVKNKASEEKIKEAIDKLHTNYQNLEAVFD